MTKPVREHLLTAFFIIGTIDDVAEFHDFITWHCVNSAILGKSLLPLLKHETDTSITC